MRIAFINEYLAYDVLKGGPASIFKPAKAQIEQDGQDVNSFVDTVFAKFEVRDRNLANITKRGINESIMTLDDVAVVLLQSTPLK